MIDFLIYPAILVAALGSEQFGTRAAADDALENYHKVIDVSPWLTAGARHNDLEIRRRCQRLLERCQPYFATKTLCTTKRWRFYRDENTNGTIHFYDDGTAYFYMLYNGYGTVYNWNMTSKHLILTKDMNDIEKYRITSIEIKKDSKTVFLTLHDIKYKMVAIE